MITNREIADAANEWQIRHDVVEKDYVLGWLLAGIAAHPATEPWAFKGGTCLRKCWCIWQRCSVRSASGCSTAPVYSST